MAVHVHNISVVVMVNNFEPSWFLHATAKEMHLDGSILHNTKSLVVTASLNDAEVNDAKAETLAQIFIVMISFSDENASPLSCNQIVWKRSTANQTMPNRIELWHCIGRCVAGERDTVFGENPIEY